MGKRISNPATNFLNIMKLKGALEIWSKGSGASLCEEKLLSPLSKETKIFLKNTFYWGVF